MASYRWAEGPGTGATPVGIMSYLRAYVFIENAFDNEIDPLPGIALKELLTDQLDTPAHQGLFLSKIAGGCRKLCLSWEGAKRALSAEAEFYSTTIHDAPAL